MERTRRESEGGRKDERGGEGSEKKIYTLFRIFAYANYSEKRYAE